jgi:hypothetical protein
VKNIGDKKMRRGKSRIELQNMFNGLKKNWYSIYNWPPINSRGYLDEVSDIILNSYDTINLDLTDLRKNNFWLKDSHIGTCQIKPTKTLQEKRICRALFNYNNLGILGNAKDYEVPLKGNNKSKHGDIDLLSVNGNDVFISIPPPSIRRASSAPVSQAFSLKLSVSLPASS